MNVKEEHILAQRIVPTFSDMPAKPRITAIRNFLCGPSEDTVNQLVSIARTIRSKIHLSAGPMWKQQANCNQQACALHMTDAQTFHERFRKQPAV